MDAFHNGLHVGGGRREGEVDTSCENLVAWRLGEVCMAVAKNPGGDPIDTGLKLVNQLKAAGYAIHKEIK